MAAGPVAVEPAAGRHLEHIIVRVTQPERRSKPRACWSSAISGPTPLVLHRPRRDSPGGYPEPTPRENAKQAFLTLIEGGTEEQLRRLRALLAEIEAGQAAGASV